MKVPCVVLVVFLACSSTVSGERCKAIQTKTSTLRCGDKVYSRPAKHLDAFNQCIAGVTDISTVEILCFYKKLGVTNASGGVDNEKMKSMMGEVFTDPAHLEALFTGILECQEGNILSDPYAMHRCSNPLYEMVCGHKSCDWINSD